MKHAPERKLLSGASYLLPLIQIVYRGANQAVPISDDRGGHGAVGVLQGEGPQGPGGHSPEKMTAICSRLIARSGPKALSPRPLATPIL